jgi:hypothetical protein
VRSTDVLAWLPLWLSPRQARIFDDRRQHTLSVSIFALQMPRIRHVVLGAAFLASASACFSYQPASFSQLQPEADVRVELTAPGVERLRSGRNNEARLLRDFILDGKLAQVSGDSLVVKVPTTTVPDPGARSVTFFQPVTIARGEVRRTDLRVLDRKRTTIASIVLGTLSLAAAIYAIERGGESSGTTPSPGGPNEIRLPALLRLSLP